MQFQNVSTYTGYMYNITHNFLDLPILSTKNNYFKMRDVEINLMKI